MTTSAQRISTERHLDNLVALNNICASFYKEDGKNIIFDRLASAHRGKGSRPTIKVSRKAADSLSAKKWTIINDIHHTVRHNIGGRLGKLYDPITESPAAICNMATTLVADKDVYSKQTSILLKAAAEIGGKDVMKSQTVPLHDIRNTIKKDAETNRPEIISLDDIKTYLDAHNDQMKPETQDAVQKAYAVLDQLETKTSDMLTQFKEEAYAQDMIMLRNNKGESILVQNKLPARQMHNVEEPQIDDKASVSHAFFVMNHLADSDQGTLKANGVFAEQAGHYFGDKGAIIPNLVTTLKQSELSQKPMIQDIFADAKATLAGKVVNQFKTFKGLKGFVAREEKMNGLLENLDLLSTEQFKAAKTAHAQREAENARKNVAKMETLIVAKKGGCPFGHG